MIPKAKKNLHSCKYHIENMLGSRHFEEVEINFAAFVRSARSVTFVLKKEFNKNPKFVSWYASKEDEMRKDKLCVFFKNLRNKVVKEGITGLHCSTVISSLNTSTDMLDKPKGAGVLIGATGMYYIVKQGTPHEDKIELTINYTTLAAPPADSLKVSCSKKDDKTKKWQVTLTYNINNPTSSAKQYRLGVGTSRTGDLLVDKVVKPKSPDTSQSFTSEFVVTEGATHYAAYAYAKCEDCDEFSPTSLWEEFRCNEPTGTPSPTPSS